MAAAAACAAYHNTWAWTDDRGLVHIVIGGGGGEINPYRDCSERKRRFGAFTFNGIKASPLQPTSVTPQTPQPPAPPAPAGD
jgi:hypothetical protein